jgi:hypothetical protein
MTWRPVPGDPLTGSLPATRLVTTIPALGPTRRDRSRTSWPVIPDPQAISERELLPGTVAVIRTRLGIRRWQVRVVRRSKELGRNRGRHYVVGHTRKGWCRRGWLDQVIKVESVGEAIR